MIYAIGGAIVNSKSEIPGAPRVFFVHPSHFFFYIDIYIRGRTVDGYIDGFYYFIHTTMK